MGRNTVETKGDYLILEVKAKTVIGEGTIVALENGFAIPAKKAENLVVIGRAENLVDNGTGTNGDVTIKVKRGVFLYDNDTTNTLTREHIGKNCYILNEFTVTSLDTGVSVAGKVLGFSDNQVIVEIK